MQCWFWSEIVFPSYILLPTHLYFSILLNFFSGMFLPYVFIVQSLNILFYFSVLKNGLKVLAVACGTVRNLSSSENKIWWVCYTYLLNYCHKPDLWLNQKVHVWRTVMINTLISYSQTFKWQRYLYKFFNLLIMINQKCRYTCRIYTFLNPNEQLTNG